MKKKAWIRGRYGAQHNESVGNDIQLRGGMGTGKEYLAWRFGCWLAGWPVTGGLKTLIGGVAGSWLLYEVVIEILYPYLLNAVDLHFERMVDDFEELWKFYWGAMRR